MLEICSNCVIRRANAFACERMDEKTAKDFMDFVTPKIKEAATPQTFYDMDEIWIAKAKEILQTDDLYHEKKVLFQKAFYPIQNELYNSLKNSEDVLFDAFRLSGAGNIIDFTCVYGIAIDNANKVIGKVKNMPLDRDLYNTYLSELKSAKTMAYMLDNVGEDVMDMVYIRKLKEQFPLLEITALVKDIPISGDTTREDAILLGLDKMVKVVGMGKDYNGSYAPNVSKEAREVISSSDVVLAKGMANFEAFAGSDNNIYYLFLCKCDEMYGRFLGFKTHELLFLSDKHSSNMKRFYNGKWKFEV